MQINLKTIPKEDWIKLLKRDLVPIPAVFGEPDQYTTPENVIVTVTTKNKIRRNNTFGGPIWSALLDFSDTNELRLSFLSPLKKPKHIKWGKVKEMKFLYLSA